MCESRRFYIAIRHLQEEFVPVLKSISILVRSRNDLTNLTRELTKDGTGKRTWNDPEPVEEPLPGTVKGMGIEVGIKARLLWPGGVLVDTKYDDYAEAIRLTKALIADPTVSA